MTQDSVSTDLKFDEWAASNYRSAKAMHKSPGQRTGWITRWSRVIEEGYIVYVTQSLDLEWWTVSAYKLSSFYPLIVANRKIAYGRFEDLEEAKSFAVDALRELKDKSL